MMTFEELKPHVCALEQGQKLDKLGLPVNSLFAWIIRRDDTMTIVRTDDALKLHSRGKTKAFYAAWLSSEMGLLVPRMMKLEWSAERYREPGYDILLHRINWKIECKSWVRRTEALAKADLLIHLLEQKIIKPEDLTL